MMTIHIKLDLNDFTSHQNKTLKSSIHKGFFSYNFTIVK